MATDSQLACTTNPDSHSYLLHSSSHPAHVKNSIPCSQFLRLRRLCSDDTDFSEKAEEMCQFFKTRGYPDLVLHNSKHRAQSVHPQSAPLSSHNKLEGRIPLTLTFHPHNISVKNIILKNFKLLQHEPTNAEIFRQPYFVFFVRLGHLVGFKTTVVFFSICRFVTFSFSSSSSLLSVP